MPTLEHDREVLSWLQCSTQLSSDVTGYLCDTLLDWALRGRGYPQMALPDAGPDCDHLQAAARTSTSCPRARRVVEDEVDGPLERVQAVELQQQPEGERGFHGIAPRATAMSAPARCTTSCRTDVLPIPPSPWTNTTPPRPSREAQMRAAAASSVRSRSHRTPGST
jgi:hypothetical protein